MQSRNLKFTDTVEPAWWSFANRTGTCTTQNTNYQTGTAKKHRHNWSFGIILKRRVASSWSMTTFGRRWHVALQHHALEDWPNNKVQQKLTHQRFQYNNFQHTTTTQFGATHTHTLMTVSHHCTLFYCLNSYINPLKTYQNTGFTKTPANPALDGFSPTARTKFTMFRRVKASGERRIFSFRWCKKWMNIFFGYVWIICI